MKNSVKACMLQLWNAHLLRAEFDHPEVILCGWQDIKVQLLTNLSVALQLSTKDEHHHHRLHHVEKSHWPHWPWPCLRIMDAGAPAPCYFSFLFCVGSWWTHVDRFLWYTSPGDTPGSALRLVASKIHLSCYCCCGLCCAGERHTHYTVVGWKNKHKIHCLKKKSEKKTLPAWRVGEIPAKYIRSWHPNYLLLFLLFETLLCLTMCKVVLLSTSWKTIVKWFHPQGLEGCFSMPLLWDTL